MTSPELDVVDVARDGRWRSQVLLLEVTSVEQARAGAERMSAARAGTPYVGVLSADLGPELPGILAALRTGLREIVCFDALTGEPGQDLALRTIEELGFGQDSVFTVPMLEDAVDYAVDALLRPERGGWEGRFVVVLGPRPVLDRAHRHLTASRPPA
jgi:hypothetical protein